MKIKELTVEQLQALIEAKLEEILGDPDDGLELRDEVIEKLKAQKTSGEKRIPF